MKWPFSRRRRSEIYEPGPGIAGRNFGSGIRILTNDGPTPGKDSELESVDPSGVDKERERREFMSIVEADIGGNIQETDEASETAAPLEDEYCENNL